MKRIRIACPGRANRGFSLTELMIVVSIMGVLLAVVTPGTMRFLSSWRLEGEVSKMATVMRAARSTAVSKNINVIFVFDEGDGVYYTVEDTDGDGKLGGGERKGPEHTLPAGMVINDFSMGQQWVTFGPKGNTGDGGTITLQGKREATRTIRVYSGTGNISVD